VATGLGSNGGIREQQQQRGCGSWKRRQAQDGDASMRPRRQVAAWRVWVTHRVPVTRVGGRSGGLLDPRRVVGRVTGVEMLTGGGCGFLPPTGFPPAAMPSSFPSNLTVSATILS
jgi:hypothetical protein